ncbi:uncharacterized protein LOC141902556 isoform X2 [Tubulanus polymorphus]|uniref:uncharacterized protein LOC141902556 isoform X2 n=1 Tax=Tubulanus polymorphus TaxID=672921 RepID=UPI003DA2667B
MVKFTLDHATYQKVMEGDQETINQLAENYSEAFRVPSAGIEINPKSEQRDTAIQEREASTSVPPGHSVARKTGMQFYKKLQEIHSKEHFMMPLMVSSLRRYPVQQSYF